MKHTRFIKLIGLAAILSVPIRSPAPVSVVAGYNSIVNPNVSGAINTILPIAGDGDLLYSWNTSGSYWNQLIEYLAAGPGWYDASFDVSTFNWQFGVGCMYFCSAAGGETLNFGADPPQPVPVVQTGYNLLGNVTSHTVGYDDIALGQLDQKTCPAFRWNPVTSKFDAYIYGASPPLTVNPYEAVFFLKPSVLAITPNPANRSQLMVTWDGVAELQTTSSLTTGTWTSLPAATSPYTVNLNQTNALFFRVQMPSLANPF